MGNNTTDQAAYFAELKAELAITGRPQAYNIVHCMNIEPRSLWVMVDLSLKALCGLFAYIEHVAFDITNECGHSLSEQEMMQIVDKFYREVQYLDGPHGAPGTYYEVDLYVNWETHSALDYVEGMPELQRDGLLDFVRELAVTNDWKQERSNA